MFPNENHTTTNTRNPSMAPWSCSRCTFENNASASSCTVCTHKRTTISTTSPIMKTVPAKKPASSALRNSTPAKKAKTSSNGKPSPPTGGAKMHSFLASVGSSKEQEAKKMASKIQQMRELGIDLADDRMAELLAKNCFCVPIAASEYFERMATEQDTSSATQIAARDERVAQAISYFERSFLNEPFLLLGSSTMDASISRLHAQLTAGDRLIFQGENVGNKRARPTSATASTSVASSTATSSWSSSSPSGLPAVVPVTSTANGIVRVSTFDHVQLGRLEREMEVIFHPLLKEGLVSLGGVCLEPPLSQRVFASFKVLLFVYVHPRAFDIFHDDHALFHLSDALYFVLDSIGNAGGKALPSSSITTTTTPSGEQCSTDGDGPALPDLETLFSSSAAAGPAARSSTATATSADDQMDPAEQLAPFFKDNFELRSHQKQALSWMLWREKQVIDAASETNDDDDNPLWEKRFFHSKVVFYINTFEKIASFTPPAPPTPCLGGILADDMGMGKTVMLLALIAYRRHFDDSAPPPSLPRSTASTTKKNKQRQGKTLIVCPLSLLHQWKLEVEDRFRANTLRVSVYYGDERNAGTSKSDIVLTTYGVLTSEFEKTPSTSPLLTTEWERMILDEAHSIKTRTTSYFRATSSLQATHRWCLTGTPLQNSLSDLFSLLCFLKYEPWSRVAWWQRVIARPFDQGDEDALARLKVLLQPILLRRTKLSRDVQGNRIVELPPKKMELVRLTFSEQERGFYQAVFDRSRAEFNGFVASGSTMSSYIAIFALLLRLRQACDHPFLALGRNSQLADSSRKQQGDDSKALRLERQAGESMDSYFSRISCQLQQDAANAAAATTQQHQAQSAASAPAPASSSSSLYIQNVLTQIQEEGIDAQECPVCLDPPQCGVLTPCAHLLCEGCLRDSITSDPEAGCPVCRAPVEMAKVYALVSTAVLSTVSDETEEVPTATTASPSSASSSSSSLFVSAKLRRLLEDLQTVRDEDDREAAEAAAASASTPTTATSASATPARHRRKVVVFSQWTHMLEMVVELLHQNQFKTCMFHGAMNQETREKVLRKFHQDPQMDVLVISLKAGGVGLNLTCASVVVLLDPWWNPGVEDQAIDRVHRLGQTRDVVVKRYVVDHTVEEMILQLQERKQKLAKNVLIAAKTTDDHASERLSMQDLLQFFK